MINSSFGSVKELIECAETEGIEISQVVLNYEKEQNDVEEKWLIEKMTNRWDIMKTSVEEGLKDIKENEGVLVKGVSSAIYEAINNSTIADDRLSKVMMRAAAVSEVNASMGVIVAAPTAGSCGILPAVLMTAQEERYYSDQEIVKALFTSAGIGLIISRNATISGAEGGCQAECGTAAAMASAALVELAGGSPEQVGEAVGLCLKNALGLVCDPVGGLIEVPCIKRNSFLAANALVGSDMSLAGIKSVIPPDEVIGAMKSIGEEMSQKLKETAEGGLAATPTGERLSREIHGT